MSTQPRPQDDASPALEFAADRADGSIEIGGGVVVDVPSAGFDRAPAAGSASPSLRLASGRRAQFARQDGDDVLTVSAVDGRVELSVRFTEAGPVLSFEAAGIRLRSAGEVAVACERFRVEARESVALRSAGFLEAVAEGEAVVRAEGAARIEGYAVEVRSRRGNVELKANDDVRLRGERIKLNC